MLPAGGVAACADASRRKLMNAEFVIRSAGPRLPRNHNFVLVVAPGEASAWHSGDGWFVFLSLATCAVIFIYTPYSPQGRDFPEPGEGHSVCTKLGPDSGEK